MSNEKENMAMLVISFLLLLVCIVVYYNWPILANFSAENPIPCRQIAPASIIAIVIWALAAILDPKKYFSFLNFLGTGIVWTTLFTGFFILAKVAQ